MTAKARTGSGDRVTTAKVEAHGGQQLREVRGEHQRVERGNSACNTPVARLSYECRSATQTSRLGRLDEVIRQEAHGELCEGIQPDCGRVQMQKRWPNTMMAM